MNLDYLIGQPGAGKSTLIQHVARGSLTTTLQIAGVGCVSYSAPDGSPIALEIGRHRDAFSGTDALSMSVLPKALDALDELGAGEPDWHHVFAEGDRLATLKFFDGARARGWAVTVIRLDVDNETASQRRRQRGSTQSESWLRGRVTKIDRLTTAARERDYPVIDVVGDEMPDALAAQIDTPVLGRFRKFLAKNP